MDEAGAAVGSPALPLGLSLSCRSARRSAPLRGGEPADAPSRARRVREQHMKHAPQTLVLDCPCFGGVSCFTFRWVAVFRVSLFGRQPCFVFHFSPHGCVSRVSCFGWTGDETPLGPKPWRRGGGGCGGGGGAAAAVATAIASKSARAMPVGGLDNHLRLTPTYGLAQRSA